MIEEDKELKMGVKLYQEYLVERLSGRFGRNEVISEWSSMVDENDLRIYSPRLDLAVGPFATHRKCGFEYDDLLDQPEVKRFIKRLIEHSNHNLELFDDHFLKLRNLEDIKYKNYNARCFLAIEIENMVSRKHLMGGAINASALGRIGIVIPWSEEKLRAFIKLVRYLQYLGNAGKNTFHTDNLLIVTIEQLEEAMRYVRW